MTNYDVIVVGGAITGASSAFHLLRRSPGLRVCVIETDPTYRHAATALSTAGVRILFSQPENIRMSQYGHEFYGQFKTILGLAGDDPDVGFHRQGYLFIANTPEQAEDMRLNYELQTSMGCRVELLEAEGLARLFPSYNTSDVLAAVHSPDDGWLDPMAAVQGLVKAIRRLGGEVIHDKVTAIHHNAAAVTGVTTEKGRTLRCGTLVNATGAWSNILSAQIGMKLPVEPLPRMVYFFRAEDTLPPLPLTLDGLGAGFRPEGAGFICGVTEYGTVGRFCFEVDYSYFDETVWPRLAHRVPAFERIRLGSAWVGHYDQNTFDGNVIVGRWTGGLENYIVTSGSSGHGFQHAPAIGRAVSELVVDGGFTTIDLSRFSYRRVRDGTPYPERGAKA